MILSVPLFLLYESGIMVAMVIERGKKRREAQEAREEEAEARREAAEEEARRRMAVASVTTPQGTLPAGSDRLIPVKDRGPQESTLVLQDKEATHGSFRHTGDRPRGRSRA